MHKKKSNLIKTCWWIFSISIIVAFFSYGQIHWLENTDREMLVVAEFYANLSLGLFCSSVLVLFVEKYHENQEKIRRLENKAVFLSKLTYQVNKIEEAAMARCEGITRLNAKYKYNDEKSWIENVNAIEVPWLEAIIALGLSSKEKLFLKPTEITKLDYNVLNSVESNAHSVFIGYGIEFFNLRDLEITLKEMNLRLLKSTNVIEIEEFMSLEILLELIREFHKYLYDVNPNYIVRPIYIVNIYKIIISQLESLYDLIEEGKEENIKILME